MAPENHQNLQQKLHIAKNKKRNQIEDKENKDKVYAIISDIHANIEALTEVLADIKNNHDNIEQWFCLGDLVSYNPAPNQCIETVRQLGNVQYVAGNHDQATVGLLDITWFNHSAKRAITWTKKELHNKHKQFLKSLDICKKVTAAGKTIILAHGSPDPEQPFDYLLRPYDIQKIEPYLFGTDIVFVGHTHVPGYFQISQNKIHQFKGAGDGLEIRINSDEKYIINAGSIGQPRDGIPRASYVLYYPEQNRVTIHRTSYNIEKVQKEIRNSGLPGPLADRLAVGR